MFCIVFQEISCDYGYEYKINISWYIMVYYDF